MYCNKKKSKKFLCKIDLLITMDLRIFESQQCAVIEFSKWHSCSWLPNLFSFELELEIYPTYFDLLFFELNNHCSKNYNQFSTGIEFILQTE